MVAFSVRGSTEECLALMSDAVPEARTPTDELYGFDRLPDVTLMAAQDIADVAQRFGRKMTSPF